MVDDAKPEKPPLSRRIARALLRLLAIAVAVEVGLSTLLYVMQDRLLFHPRSLAPAVHLASQRPLRAVVLTTPYDSIAAVGQAHYPIVPVRPLLHHPFDSLSRAPSIHTPALMLVAAEDTIIPPPHARRLYESWAGPKEWELFAGRGHNDIPLSPEYWPRIRTFLAESASPR